MWRISGNLILVILLALCIWWIGCGDDGPVDSDGDVDNTDFSAEASFRYAVEVAHPSRLKLEAINGSVTVSGISESDSVIVAGDRRVRSESTQDAEEHLQLLEVYVVDLGHQVFTETRQPEEPHGRIYEVDYRIALPRNLEVIVDNVNGTVTIDSIDEDVSVDNVNGQVILTDIVGSTLVNLINGQIESDVTLPLDGIIDMDVVNGIINLDIPQNTSAQFSASVMQGDITILNLILTSNPVLRNPVSPAATVSGTLGDGRGIINLDVINGNITVTGL